MIDQKSSIGEELERAVNHSQRRWEWYVVVGSIAYFLVMLFPWLRAGHPVVR